MNRSGEREADEPPLQPRNQAEYCWGENWAFIWGREGRDEFKGAEGVEVGNVMAISLVQEISLTVVQEKVTEPRWWRVRGTN